jgi:hypothetical protein
MKSEENDDELLHSNILFLGGDRLMIRKQEREVPTNNLGG